ncbi:MAG TPA: hypothetical protein EYP55_10390 [Anaerolineae bacterium]|nr:hypothetical protein [Anaerolineae bacterium]
MPAFDGTGPLGLGPMTGRGEGYCAIVLPPPGTGRAPYGYAGLAGRPVQLARSPVGGMGVLYRTPPVPAAPFAPFSTPRFGRGLGRRRGRGRRRWR